MVFKAVERNPIYLQVADQLREEILAGRLAPGEALPTERDLAEQFGVSRTSVREALRVLQAQHLVSGGDRTAPYRTTVVDELSTESLRLALVHTLRLRGVGLSDLVELRCAIEASALSRAAARAAAGDIPAEHLAAAREALEEMGRPGAGADRFHAADVRFHVALVAASGNEAMHAIMMAVRESIAEHLLAALAESGDGGGPVDRVLARLTAEHGAILEAVETGDGPRAEALVREHIESFYRSIAGGQADAADGADVADGAEDAGAAGAASATADGEGGR